MTWDNSCDIMLSEKSWVYTVELTYIFVLLTILGLMFTDAEHLVLAAKRN